MNATRSNDIIDIKKSESKIGTEVLDILQAVEQSENITQRHLAKRVGIALGLANSYLKRCIKKGLIKVKQAPANRYLYYLTPKGFTEKSRLTAEYLTESFSFYRSASYSVKQLLAHCARENLNEILLLGESELAEIVCLNVMGTQLSVVGIYDSGSDKEKSFGNRIYKALPQIPNYDICILTDLRSPVETVSKLQGKLDDRAMLVPELLKKFLPEIPDPKNSEDN